MASDMSELIGKTIKSVRLDEGALLIIETDDGVYGYSAVGECCSSSYFYEITGVEKVIGRKVLDVTEIYLDHGPAEEEDEMVQVYGIRISTEPGTVQIQDEVLETSNSMFIVYRNLSNGYYGGWISREPVAEVKGKVIESSWSLE